MRYFGWFSCCEKYRTRMWWSLWMFTSTTQTCRSIWLLITPNMTFMWVYGIFPFLLWKTKCDWLSKALSGFFTWYWQEIIRHHRDKVNHSINQYTIKTLLWQLLNGLNYLHRYVWLLFLFCSCVVQLLYLTCWNACVEPSLQ